jgi:PAS domain S-box-containing protein
VGTLASTPPPEPTEADLRQALEQSALPVAVLDLTTMQLTAANRAACEITGRTYPIEPLGIGEVLSPDEAEHARHALQLIADGTIHGYEARRKLMRTDGVVVESHVWVRGIENSPHPQAFIVFMPEGAGKLAPEDYGDLPSMRLALGRPVAVGSMEIDTRIIRISAEIEKLLGQSPARVRGTLMVDRVHPEDVATFLMALASALDHGEGMAMHVRVCGAPNEYVPLHVLVSPGSGQSGLRVGLVLTRESAASARSDDRIAELEQHLWRIGVEVQAAGVADGMHRLPDAQQLPGLEELSTRQWQILTRLLQGERVPAIAQALFVSQSTVRSHLAEIFRKLNVRSQADLISLFRQSPTQRNV